MPWVAGSVFFATALMSGVSWAQPQPQMQPQPQPQAQWGAQVGTQGASWNASGAGYTMPKKQTGFGVFNDIVITGTLGNVLSYTGRNAPSDNGDSRAGKSRFEVGLGTNIGPGLGLDYFIIDGLSLGGDLRYVKDRDDWSASVTPRVGYNIDFNDTFSMWPQLGIRYTANSTTDDTFVQSASTATSTTFTTTRQSSVFSIVLNVPFLYHVAKNFFIGAGPTFSTDVSSKVKIASTNPATLQGTTDGIKETTIGLAALVGGHF